MQYVHVKKLEEYHPSYKDRELKWCKAYFKMINADPEFEMAEEIDRWRFIAFVMLELQTKKPVPLDQNYLKRKGFDLKKRPIIETLTCLSDSLEVIEGTSYENEPKLQSINMLQKQKVVRRNLLHRVYKEEKYKEEEYREEKSREEDDEDNAAPVLETTPLSLFSLFKAVVKNLPQPRELTTDRALKCKLRLRERPLTEWQEVFERLDRTPFLLGENQTGWRASFDWIISNQTNAVKVLEGKYDQVKPKDDGLTKQQRENIRQLRELEDASRNLPKGDFSLDGGFSGDDVQCKNLP